MRRMGIRLAVRPIDAPKPASGGESSPSESVFEFDQGRVVIGRGRGSDVQLPHASVSTRHATLQAEGAGYMIIDHGSTNGSFVDGQRVTEGRPKPIRTGQRIRIGVFELLPTLGVPATQAMSAAKTASIARRLVRDALIGWEHEPPILRILGGPDDGASLSIPEPPARLTIGRGASCDLQLSDSEVSREHLELISDLDGVLVRHLGSKNGVTINGKRVEERRLLHGDELKIGATRLLFEDASERVLGEVVDADDELTPSHGGRAGRGSSSEVARDLPRKKDDLSAIGANTRDSTASDSPATSDSPTASDAPASSEESPPTHPRPAPTLAEVTARRGKTKASRRLGTTARRSADALIYVLAAAVLGASLLALFYLLGSG